MISFLFLLPSSLPLPQSKAVWEQIRRMRTLLCLRFKSLAERKTAVHKVALLHWFILWWEKQSGRMAAHSREGQRPVEWSESHRGKARLLKRVTILLHWSTNCKTYKCGFILFRGQVQGYRMSFTKEEVSIREALLTAAHPLSGFRHGSHPIQCSLGEQHWAGKSNNKASLFHNLW